MSSNLTISGASPTGFSNMHAALTSSGSLSIGTTTINSQGITFGSPGASISYTAAYTSWSPKMFADYYMLVHDMRAKETAKLTPSDLYSIYKSMSEKTLFSDVKSFLTHLYKTIKDPDYQIQILLIPQ